MRLLRRLERDLGRFAIPHLTLGLVVIQAAVYLLSLGLDARPEVHEGLTDPISLKLALIPERVLAGEVWRLVTFLALPPFTNPIFAILFLYFFWMLGTALEQYWGDFRFNLFLLIGYLATVGAAFVVPSGYTHPVSNAFLQGSVFLAFAYLNPEFPVALFFVILVPIKWLARLTWAGYLLTLTLGDWPTRLTVLAAIANFLLFFGWEVWETMRTGQRRMARRAQAFAAERDQPDYYHKCLVCGITDRSHRTMEFRYCSQCAGSCCYCSEHLRAHAHVASPP